MEHIIYYYDKYIQTNIDKVLHFVLAFALVDAFRASLFIIFLTTLLIFIKEIVDKKYRKGKFDVYDVIAGLAGVMFAILWCLVF